MCGIAGFVGQGFKNPQSKGLLERMSELIAHRGPDADGLFYNTEQGVGFAHRRLSIIDLSDLGAQPMWDHSGQVVITFNGEIYNYRELKDQLEKRGVVFKGASDTEVLLQLYLEYGKRALEQLNGIFAFAIWDCRSQTLLIARDGLGVKPLYYAETSQGFVFASEIKSMLAHPEIGQEIRTESVVASLSYLWCPHPHTMFQKVFKVKPGHALEINQSGKIAACTQYYTIPWQRAEKLSSWEEALSATSDGLERAVRRQLVSDVPVGAFLSGGLDSSTVVALAKREYPRELLCFCIKFDDSMREIEGFVDDLPYARLVAKHLGVKLEAIEAKPSMVEDLSFMLYHLDEPQADLAALNVFYISRCARQQGIKVLLSGAGGDDVFSGYRRHSAIMKEKYLQAVPAFCWRGLYRSSQAISIKHPMLRRARKMLELLTLSPPERLRHYFHWLDSKSVGKMLSPDYKRQVSQSLSSDSFENTLSELPEGMEDLDRMLHLELQHFVPDHNLNYVDKMSMAAGIEVRVPMLDLELVELGTRLPVQFKHRYGQGKWILREAAKRYLPSEILHRPKTGFGVPLRAWMNTSMPELFHDLFSPASVSNRGIFDYQGLETLWQKNRAGSIDAAYPLFAAMCIELWCRLLVDGRRSFEVHETKAKPAYAVA